MPRPDLNRLRHLLAALGHGVQRTWAMIAITLAAMLAVLPATAQEDLSAWAARHGVGSIQSTETADQVLREAEAARKQVEARYLAEQRICYDRFFVSYCLEKAAEKYRGALQLIRPLEIEANVWKRQAKVDERDRNLEQQREREQQDAQQRAEQQRQRQAATAEKVERNARDAQAAAEKSKRHEGEADRRAAEHAARRKQQEQEEAAKIGERAQNIAEYEKKRLESEARQREVAAKKAERARQKAAREAAPGTPAGTPSVPAKP